MELLLSALAGLPEFSALASLLTAGETAALSGVGQLPRSHFLAGLTRAVSRPALILCPDDQSAQKCQLELAAFLGAAPALLPSREFTFCEAAVVSRGWEQRRLHLLWKLGKGQIPILVSSLEALSLRTMPPAVLFSAAVTLRPGASFDLEDLSRRLTAAGYARTSLVEGVGQFSIRGGILTSFPRPTIPPSAPSSGATRLTCSPSLTPSPSGAPRSCPRLSFCPWPRPSPTSTPRARLGSSGRFKSS